jgi:hypothetical protein
LTRDVVVFDLEEGAGDSSGIFSAETKGDTDPAGMAGRAFPS